MHRPLTIVCAAKLQENLARHLEPLDLSEDVARIIVVRHAPIGQHLRKVENVSFGDGGTLRNMGRMLATVDRVLARERVDWVLGFNPVPWAALGAAAAARHRVPVSLSFVGRDFKQIQRPWAAPLWLAVRHARLITVTGERMRRGLVERGIPADKIRVLPHVIDTERFSPATVEPDVDIVSVGGLIRRKRHDVLIDAVARLKRRGRLVRVLIAGEGPLRPVLEQQIRDQDVGDRVELLGFRRDVEQILRRGRLFVLVSDWEGVPFAMVEACCTGLVPIVTDVGTITDFVEHERNGHVVPVGDGEALARSIERLLGDPEHYRSLRDAALRMRQSLSLEQGVTFWREALGLAARGG
ncbi:MAG: glycosyltransferase family 4 protein [Polyangiaceae bacterium]